MVKLVTVITSTYNKGERNRASVQSVLNQSFADFEYIIVNDGSPDSTKDILREFSDPRLKTIHQENQGFTKTMVSIINQIETPYIAIQGAGDISLPHRLERQVEYLQSNPNVGLVAGIAKRFSASSALSGFQSTQQFGFKKKQDIILYDSVDQMITTNIINHGEVMLRTSAYREAGGYRTFFQYAQDRDLWLRILEKGYFIVRIPETFYIWLSDAKADITGNPVKAEKQAFYSLFAQYLARQRELTGKDLLEENGSAAFEHYINNALNAADKIEIVKRVFRNSLRSRHMLDEAIEIVGRHAPEHRFYKFLKLLRFMNKHVPYGGEICCWYYKQVERRFLQGRKKMSRLIESVI